METRVPTTPDQPEVAIHRVGPSVQESVRETLEAINWASRITAGADVALKVNLTHDMLMPGKHPYGFRFDEASGNLRLTDRLTGELLLAEPAAPGQTRYPSGADPEAQEDYWKRRRAMLGTWGL